MRLSYSLEVEVSEGSCCSFESNSLSEYNSQFYLRQLNFPYFQSSSPLPLILNDQLAFACYFQSQRAFPHTSSPPACFCCQEMGLTTLTIQSKPGIKSGHAYNHRAAAGQIHTRLTALTITEF